MNFAYMHQADGLLKDAFKQFHDIVTGESMHGEFLNYYEYEDDAPSEETFVDIDYTPRNILQKKSYLSPLDMDDPLRIDCMKFIPDHVKKQILFIFSDTDKYYVVPKQIDVLKENGMIVPDGITTQNQVYDFVEKNASAEEFETINESLQNIERDIYDRYAFDCVFKVFFNIEAVNDDSVVLTLRMEGAGPNSETGIIYESSEFDPADESQRTEVLDNFIEWVNENYDPAPWLNQGPTPQVCSVL